MSLRSTRWRRPPDCSSAPAGSLTFCEVAAFFPQPEVHLPKRNYGFEKRQKELAKAEKRKLKAERRAERASDPAPEEPELDQPVLPEPEPGK
jgi:hypothetical protein